MPGEITVTTAARNILTKFTDDYDTNAGVGPDAYCPEPMAHPMADGKFLYTIAQMKAARLLGDSRFANLASGPLKRLAGCALALGPQGIGWGLNFVWEAQGCAKQDPFLITSAVVARGLLACGQATTDGFAGEDLLGKAMAGLAWWYATHSVPIGGVTLPVYGLNTIREPIFNSAAYALGTLLVYQDHRQAFSPDQARKKLQYILDQAVPHVGWPYSTNSNVIDLLHQGYIANTMIDVFGAPQVCDLAKGVFGQFAGPQHFADVLKLVNFDDTQDEGKALYFSRSIGVQRLLVKPAKARLWSLGEMLVGISKIAASDKDNPLWRRYSDLVARHLLARLSGAGSEETSFPRHTTHAAHGLAAFLAYRRGFPVL